jgi:hypothetical protein
MTLLTEHPSPPPKKKSVLSNVSTEKVESVAAG